MKALRAVENKNTDTPSSIRWDKATKRDLDSSLALLRQMYGMRITQRVLIQRAVQMYHDHLVAGIIRAKQVAEEPKLRIGKDLSKFQKFHDRELKELYVAAGREEEVADHE